MSCFRVLLLVLWITSLQGQVCTIDAQNANQDLCTACSTGTNPAVVDGRFTGRLNVTVSYTIGAQCLSNLIWDQSVEFYIDRGANLTFAQDPTVAANTTVAATEAHHRHSGTISAYGQLYYPRTQAGGDSYSDFAARMQSTAGMRSLPVDLLRWEAEDGESAVSLQWSTAQEEGADYFELYHSATGRSFVPIARVRAAGYSSQMNEYEWTDTRNLVGEVHYYRLLQYDYDGTVAHLGIRSVRRPSPFTPSRIHPNPARAGASLSLHLPQSVDEVVLLDAMGRVIRTYPARSPRVHIRLPYNLSAGLYVLRVGKQLARLQVV